MPKNKVNRETGLLRICFNDGMVELFNPTSLPETQQRNLMLIGLSNVLRDTWAGKADTEAAYDNCMGRWEALTEDRWTQRGVNTPRTSILLRALLMIDPSLDESELRKSLQEMDKAKRKTIEGNVKVADYMAKVKAIDATKRAEAAALKAADAEPIDVASLIA